MSTTPKAFAMRHKLLLASLATVTLSLGAAGVVSAQSDPAPPAPTEEDSGADCVDGTDAATGAECDGGPSANAANDPAEGDDGEAEEPEGPEAADEVDGVDCEDGIGAATGAECDGGPSANRDNDPNEADDGDEQADASTP